MALFKKKKLKSWSTFNKKNLNNKVLKIRKGLTSDMYFVQTIMSINYAANA